MIEANKFKLGVFVVSGVFLVFVILFMLGLSRIFEPKIHFITVFDESIQGLDVGAPVKYRGVAIGKVTRVAIRPMSGTKDNLITVEMEALPSAVDPGSKYGESENAKQEFFYEFFTKEVERGLRCRVDMAGITGIKYIEIDYFDSKTPTISFKVPEGSFYLPSTPSLFGEIAKSIRRSLIKIASVDFKKIAENIESTLNTVNKYLEDPKINKLLERLDKIGDNLELTSKNINETLTKDKINKLLARLENSLTGIDELTSEVRNQIEVAEIGETTSRLREVLSSANQMKGDISETLGTINQFVAYLDADPSSVLRGKRQKPFKFDALRRKE